MSEINWQLAQSNGAQNAFQTGFQLGDVIRQRTREKEVRSALAAYNANPEDQAAFSVIMQNSPELAVRLSDYNDKRQYNSALSDYLALQRQGVPNRPAGENVVQPGAAPNALTMAGVGALPPQPGPTAAPANSAPNALMPQGGMAPGQAQGPGSLSGYGGGTFDTSGRQVTPAEPMMGGDPAAAGGGPDMSILGEPKTARDQAFLRMMSRDPEKALKIQSTLRDSFIDRLKGEHDFYGLAVEEMGRVQDDAGWQAALSRLNPYAAVLGVDLGESVPLTYPGPEAVKGLMERALPVKERLDYLMRVANTDADNARADRNTDSIIGTREGRLDEARRNNDARLATTRRGQDLTDARTRRGQDLSAARPRGGKAAAQAGTVSNPRAVKTPTEAAALPKGTYYKTPDGRVKIR